MALSPVGGNPRTGPIDKFSPCGGVPAQPGGGVKKIKTKGRKEKKEKQKNQGKTKRENENEKTDDSNAVFDANYGIWC